MTQRYEHTETQTKRRRDTDTQRYGHTEIRTEIRTHSDTESRTHSDTDTETQTAKTARTASRAAIGNCNSTWMQSATWKEKLWALAQSGEKMLFEQQIEDLVRESRMQGAREATWQLQERRETQYIHSPAETSMDSQDISSTSSYVVHYDKHAKTPARTDTEAMQSWCSTDEALGRPKARRHSMEKGMTSEGIRKMTGIEKDLAERQESERMTNTQIPKVYTTEWLRTAAEWVPSQHVSPSQPPDSPWYLSPVSSQDGQLAHTD